MKWLAAHTWLIALVPLLFLILLSDHTGKPFDLLKATEVDYLDRDTVLVMRLMGEGEKRAKTMRYHAQLEDGSRVLLYVQNDSLPMPAAGDVLMVHTTVRRGGKAGDFDYGMYLRRQGIVGSCWANRARWQVVGHQEDKSLRAVAQRCQHYLHTRYEQMGIDGKELGIISALSLGYREELDKQVQRSFSASGAMHVLAVSGLHTGIVWAVVLWVLTLGGCARPLYHQHGRRWLLYAAAIVLLWAYAFITGLSPSVMRSALMLSFVVLTGLLNQSTSRWNALLAAAVVILLINPLALWSVSFQLSFAAVVGIMLVATRMQRRVRLKGGLVEYIGGLLMVSIAAQLGTMPLSLYYFGQTSNYFALTNLIVIPIAYVILVLGLASLALSWCPVGGWLASVLENSTWLLRQSVEWIESLPYATTQMHLSAGSVVALYGAMVAAMLMMRAEKVRWCWMIAVVVCLAGVVVQELIVNN